MCSSEVPQPVPSGQILYCWATWIYLARNYGWSRCTLCSWRISFSSYVESLQLFCSKCSLTCASCWSFLPIFCDAAGCLDVVLDALQSQAGWSSASRLEVSFRRTLLRISAESTQGTHGRVTDTEITTKSTKTIRAEAEHEYFS